MDGNDTTHITRHREVPFGLRVASTLAAVAAVLSLAIGLATAIPAGDVLTVVLVLASAGLVLAGAYFIRQGRKLGVLAIAVAWAIPSVLSILAGQIPRGPGLLLLLALIAVASSWSELR